jgi:hypothetical protein
VSVHIETYESISWIIRTNQGIYNTFKTSDIATVIKVERLRWIGHFVRPEGARKINTFLEVKPRGARRRKTKMKVDGHVETDCSCTDMKNMTFGTN